MWRPASRRADDSIVSTRALTNVFREAGRRLLVLAGAVVLTLAFFIVLPLMQTISKPPTDDLVLTAVDVGNLEPPPPPPPVEEPDSEPEPEEPPPELQEEAPPLDLAQLELALDPGFSEGWMGGGDFRVRLNTGISSGEENLDAVFSMADLDQKPRAIYQPGPTLTRELRRKAPGKVNIIFIVDERGRVVDPRVRSATDPVFEAPALKAVKRWKYEPGKRAGKAVRFRVLQPITFPK
jgi:protein TonB